MSTPVEPAPVAPVATPPVPTAPPAPPAAPAGDPAAEVARLTKELADARAEAGKSRVNAKETAAKEAREELLRLLSGDSTETLTPEQLQQKLAKAEKTSTTATKAAAKAAADLTVFRTASRLGANADALLDSVSFRDQIGAIDATDPAAFGTAVEAAIKAALVANPSLRARIAGRSTADSGGTGGSGDIPDGIDAQIADAIAKGDMATSIRLKRLRGTTQTT